MILANHGIIASSGGALSLDANALAFITAASITDNTQKTAINTLVTDLKNANIWIKMKALYPFVGGTASQHRFNLKDPRPVDSAYYLTFYGGGTHSLNGYKPDGVTAYADTKLPGNTLSVSNLHLSHYSKTQNITTTSHDMGAEDSSIGFNMNLYQYYAGSVNQKGFLDGSYPTNAAQINNTNTLGFLIGNRLTNTNQKIFFNGILIASNSNTKSLSNPPYNIVIGATNRNNTVNSYSNKESAFASIGDGLTDTEATNFYTAVQQFNTTLNRQV